MSNFLKLSIFVVTALLLVFSPMNALAAGSSPNTSVVNSGSSTVTTDEANGDDDENGVRGTPAQKP